MGSLLRMDAVVRGEETACGRYGAPPPLVVAGGGSLRGAGGALGCAAMRVRRRGGEEDADGEGGVGINVEVLGGDVVRHGEGLVQRCRGLVRAIRDPERRTSSSSRGGWRRLVEVQRP